MSFYKNLLLHLPEVRSPNKKGNLKSRLTWTFWIILLYLFLATIPLYGISVEQSQFFERIELLLGAKIGKLLTLGIGPIITSSIILQLLKGSGILKFNFQTDEGKFLYTGTHKLLTFFFIILESILFVKFGAINPQSADLFWIVVFQLALGGFLVFYMDEVVKKYGFGSGVSLFIAAGIGQAVFLLLFSPFTQSGEFGIFNMTEPVVGKIWASIYFLGSGDMTGFYFTVLGPILTTIFLFFVIVFFQSINVYIPLSFGAARGQSYRWPLNFFYAGVIPVILTSAISSNLQIWGRVFNADWFAKFENGNLVSGVLTYIQAPQDIWTSFGSPDLLNGLTYAIFFIVFCTLFSYLWVTTSGQDSQSVAKQIINSGLQIPGFRKDVRIIERILDRYIVPLTILGGIGIGLLASIADILGALTSGTGILLMVMIIYQFYTQLAKESAEDFTFMKRFLRK